MQRSGRATTLLALVKIEGASAGWTRCVAIVDLTGFGLHRASIRVIFLYLRIFNPVA